MGNLPVVVIEVVLVFGSVLAWGLWELHQLRQDDRRKRPARPEPEEHPPDRTDSNDRRA